MKKPKLIKGDFAIDDRGFVNFNNDYILSKLKRFYIVQNHKTGFIRAWHAHKHEEKFIICLTGSVMISAVKVKNFKNPNKNEIVENFFLSDRDASVLCIPKSYANGFKTLEKNTKIIFFSTSTLAQSKKDDYRFDYDYWNPWKSKFR